MKTLFVIASLLVSSQVFAGQTTTTRYNSQGELEIMTWDSDTRTMYNNRVRSDGYSYGWSGGQNNERSYWNNEIRTSSPKVQEEEDTNRLGSRLGKFDW